MIITKKGKVYKIQASPNKKIINKNNPSISYSLLTVPDFFNTDNLIEIEDANINIINYNNTKTEKDINDIVNNNSLENAKLALIDYTKSQLAIFLENHPLLYNEKLYSVSANTQSFLDSLISAAEDAADIGIHFTPYWNDKSGIREPWRLQDLKELRINIQNYILPFIIQQQNMEQNILHAKSLEELYSLCLMYQK